jgi:hypothetical protein
MQTFKRENLTRHWWLMLIILDTWEAEIGSITVGSQLK